MINDLWIIVAAGGSSRRFGGTDKLAEIIGGLPVLLHSLRNFSPLVHPGHLLVVAREESIPHYRELLAAYLPQCPEPVWVAGGVTRTGSVLNGLQAISAEDGIVAVHDAARPLADGGVLIRLVEAARIYGGAIAASPICDSVKRADGDGFIAEAVPRERLWAAETPQVFRLKDFRFACSRLNGETPTDDAEIMRLCGFRVKLVPTMVYNRKLTETADLLRIAAAVSDHE